MGGAETMEPVTLIVSALAAGALKGAGETATNAVKEAYLALKSAVAERFTGKPAAEVVLAEHEEDPETYDKALTKYVQQEELADDPRIIELAHRLMEVVDDAGARAGKYQVIVEGSQGVVIGDRNTQTNTFN
jgi:hypothetical protein